MTTSVEDAIAAAQAQAIAAAAQVLATRPDVAAGTAVATPSPAVTPGKRLTADDLTIGDLNVKAWLKVSEMGIQIGGDKALFETIPVLVDLSTVAYCYQMKFGANPVKYVKTYDRVTDAKGGSWADTIMRVQKIDARSYEYRSADIPFVYVGDTPLLGKDGKTVLAEPGDRLGNSLSTTGWKEWSALLDVLKAKGIDHNSARIEFQLSYKEQNRNGNTWGVLQFLNPSEVLDAD